ncbi:hypothetical protein M3P05_10540 [Sansalvadorimonas sp. 2012CJ34-2]|uniref:Uncharacterized protein n=1 Tax=Parendozoicomonas callyspongiae TaxID=2942213 RepID=A0ABT0PG51_9GAMM|nr:hypothetical protein [Sansalvadorimonas sp. 2012CJ34-2]MCL6270357.1 hypothetical protein [Sansalvadorimonas sp. 2012CJ34-2]
MAADIGRSAIHVYKHYKKHYDDINSLLDMSGLTASTNNPETNTFLPDDLLGLVAKTEQSLEQLKAHIGDVDDLATINPTEFKNKKPGFCKALVSYQKDLDHLFAAIQNIRSKAPKPKRKPGRKARTKKF